MSGYTESLDGFMPPASDSSYEPSKAVSSVARDAPVLRTSPPAPSAPSAPTTPKGRASQRQGGSELSFLTPPVTSKGGTLGYEHVDSVQEHETRSVREGCHAQRCVERNYMHRLRSLPASFFVLHVPFVSPPVTLPLNTSPTITTTPWGCNTSCAIRGRCEQLVTLGVRNAPSGICVLGSSFELLVFVSFLGGFEKGSTAI